MAVTGFGDGHKEGLKESYSAVSRISFEGMNYRTDLGFDL